MAIVFRCSCGKKLQAQDEFAGRKLNCPSCRHILAIPSTAAGALGAGFVRFSCRCGQKMKAHKADIGCSIECPSCGREQPIPPWTAGQSSSLDIAPEPVRRAEFSSEPIARPGLYPEPVAKADYDSEPVAEADYDSEPVAEADYDSEPVAAAALSGVLPISNNTMPKHTDDTVFNQRTTPWRDEAARLRNGPPPREPRVRQLPWLLFFLVVAAALLTAGLIMARDRSPGSGTRGLSELPLIPPESVEWVTIRFAELWAGKDRNKDSAVLKYAQLQLKDVAANLNEIERQAFFNDIERVSVIWMPPDGNAPAKDKKLGSPADSSDGQNKGDGKGQDVDKGPKKGQGKGKPPPAPKNGSPSNDTCLIVQMRKSLDLGDVQKLLFMKSIPVDADTWENRQFYRAREGDKAFYFYNDTTFVASNVAGIRHYLWPQAPSQGIHPLAAALAAEKKHDLVIGVNHTKHVPFSETVGRRNPGLPWDDMLTGVLKVDEDRDAKGKRAVTVEVVMMFPDAKMANKARKGTLRDVDYGSAEAQLPAEPRLVDKYPKTWTQEQKDEADEKIRTDRRAKYYKGVANGPILTLQYKNADINAANIDLVWTALTLAIELNLELKPRPPVHGK